MKRHASTITTRLTRSLRESETSYSRLPEPELRQAVEHVVNQGLIEALGLGKEHFKRLISELAGLRFSHGFPLPDIESALTLLRRELLDAVGSEDVGDDHRLADWLLVLWDILDAGRLGIAEAYDRLHQEHQRDLESKVQDRTREPAASHERLMQSEKLSALGELISGVAHELNNPLTGVLGFSQLLLGADVDESIAHPIKLIHEQGLRCQKIVQSLLTFSRHRKPEKKRIGLNGIVESCLELQGYALRTRNIKVVKHLEEDLPMVFGDFHQLQQVVMNLITNAQQAIAGSRDRGTLTVISRRAGGKVTLVVEDDGPGISPEHLSKIFDPFFTTKPPGEGTGLGLSICYGILQEHGGSIRAESQVGQGARFTTELPAHTSAPEANDGTRRSTTKAAPGAGQRILVVDDEPAILDLLYAALSSWGYRADAAVNGEVGLKKALRESYDLIFCDLRMPGMSGRELYERLKKDAPDKARRVAFITGSPLGTPTQRFLCDNEVPCLQKPLDLNLLQEFLVRWFSVAQVPAAGLIPSSTVID